MSILQYLEFFCNILVFPYHFFLFVVTDMSSFRANLHSPSDWGNHAGAFRPPAPTFPHAQQQQTTAGPFGAKGKKVTGEKRKWLAEDLGLESPHLVGPISFMAAAREVARAEANCQRRKRG